MSEATQTQPEGPFAATPREELERQIMCPTVPKTEREWWAADEIERLKAELLERDAVWLPEKDAEITRLRAALREIDEIGRVAAQVPGPRNKLMEICARARAAMGGGDE